MVDGIFQGIGSSIQGVGAIVSSANANAAAKRQAETDKYIADQQLQAQIMSSANMQRLITAAVIIALIIFVVPKFFK